MINTQALAGTLGGEPGDFGNPGPTFTVAATGANTVTGTIGPTGGGDSQDNFKISIPSSFQVTTISYSGPGGGNYSFNLVGCGLTGTSNLNQTLNKSNCTLNYYISANFATGASAWTVTANIIATPNSVPTDITLSNASVSPTGGVNAVVGAFSTTDADTGDTHTYTLVAGTGSTNNDLFNINGDTLRANNASTMAEGTYYIRVRTTDQDSDTFEKEMTIYLSTYPSVVVSDPADNAYSKITNVTIGSINNNSDNPVNDNYYSDYTAQSTTVATGSTYPISLTIGGSDVSDSHMKVYIDWNQNGSFAETNEGTVIISGTGASTTPSNPYTATVSVPGGALAGSTRMRVMIDWQLDPLASGVIDYGEAEDYTIQVGAPPAVIPTVTTQAVSAIGTTTATGNGNVTNLGSPNPTAHGVCWNTTGTPTTPCANNGAKSATGAFTGAMTTLTPNTTYYVRAYATNTTGTGYGNQVSFTTDPLLPDLAVSKTESIDPVIAGSGIGNLTHTVTVTNQGNASATGVTLSEAITLPAGVTVSSITPSGTGSYSPSNSPNGTWVVGNLGIGASETLTVTLTAGSSSASGADVISDTATVTALNETDSSIGNNSATISTSITREVDLVVTKTESIDPVIAGSGAGNLVYVVTVTNTGPSDASGITLSEAITLPAGVTINSITPSGTGSYAPANSPNGTWVVGNLGIGASETLTVTLTAGSSSATGANLISDTANVTALNETDSNIGNNSATISTSITREVDLVVTKTESIDPVIAGSAAGNLVYTVTVTNSGPSDATGINILEDLTLPTGVSRNSVVPSNGSFIDTTAPDGTWTLNLTSGASETLTVTLTAEPSSASGTNVISDTASITALNETDSNNGNDSATESTSITREVDLAVTKTDGVLEAEPGTSLTYTIVASNNGPSDASGVSVTDTFPANLTTCTYTSVAAGSATGNTANTGIIVDTLTMPAGSSVTYTVNCTIDLVATGTLSNTASISSSTADPVSGNNSATDNDTVIVQPPTTPDMTDATDMGASNSDNLTSTATPTFTGTAEPGSTITLNSSVNGAVGSITADGSGNWTITASALTEGNHNMAATADYPSGNPATPSSALAITIDTAAPVLSGIPGDINVNTNPGLNTAIVNWAEPTADDIQDGPITPIQTAGFTNGAAFPVGDTAVTYGATDSAGNTASASFIATVVDNEPPVISGMPADITVATKSSSQTTAKVSWTEPTADDTVDGPVVPVQTGGVANGGEFPVGITTVTYTATDALGNSSTAFFTVTVDQGEFPWLILTPGLVSPNKVTGSN